MVIARPNPVTYDKVSGSIDLESGKPAPGDPAHSKSKRGNGI
jgi:hypothetical protein